MDKPPVVIAATGSKHPYYKSQEYSPHFTHLQFARSNGDKFAPLTIHKGKRFTKDLFKGLPPGSRVAMSPNGYVSKEIFYQYCVAWEIETRKGISPGEYRMLIVDGHSSHCSTMLVEYFMEHKVVLFFMPAHSSHLLQPLDDVPFKMFKKNWRKKIISVLAKRTTKLLTRYDFPRIFGQIYEESFTPLNIVAGFINTGIVPFNPKKVLESGELVLPKPSGNPSKHKTSKDEWLVNQQLKKGFEKEKFFKKKVFFENNGAIDFKTVEYRTVQQQTPPLKFIPENVLYGNPLDDEYIKNSEQKKTKRRFYDLDYACVTEDHLLEEMKKKDEEILAKKGKKKKRKKKKKKKKTPKKGGMSEDAEKDFIVDSDYEDYNDPGDPLTGNDLDEDEDEIIDNSSNKKRVSKRSRDLNEDEEEEIKNKNKKRKENPPKWIMGDDGMIVLNANRMSATFMAIDVRDKYKCRICFSKFYSIPNCRQCTECCFFFCFHEDNELRRCGIFEKGVRNVNEGKYSKCVCDDCVYSEEE